MSSVSMGTDFFRHDFRHDPLQKANGHTSGVIFEYDITLKTKKTTAIINEMILQMKVQ